MRGTAPVWIYYLAQDDPRKNTALRLQKAGKATLVENAKKIPDRTVLLNPFAKKALSKEDAPALLKRGVVGLDCSWKQAEDAFGELLGRTHSRALPFLVAANPINWGKPFKLTTAEAIGAALWITGQERQARDLLSAVTFGDQFLQLNALPLADYAKAETSAEVVAAQWNYIDPDDSEAENVKPAKIRHKDGRRGKGEEE